MSTLTKNKVIAIAINEYNDKLINNLNNPGNDIKDILQILKLKYNFNEFIILSSPENTTRKSLFNYLMETFNNAMPDDNILLIFAGHGALNEKTGFTYWQPSDADYSDQSSWLNLSDILSFIKVSESKHIAIISDSCFAGGIIEAETRGGGINAFDSKKSREVLASGSKEKVSDGEKGSHSPFTDILISILNSNTDKNLLFNTLAIDLILKFDNNKKQTPTYGPLINTGHDGGSFVFELLEYGPSQDIKDVKLLMGNLYIEVDSEFNNKLEILKSYWVNKNKAVQFQQYQKAAEIRDDELKLIDTILIELSEKINYIDQELIEDENRNKLIETLVVKTKKHEDKIRIYRQEKRLKYADLTSKSDSSSEEDEASAGIPIIETIPFEYTDKNHPIAKKFEESKDRYFDYYKEGLIKLYIGFATDFIGIDNKFVLEKYSELVNILYEAYKTQIILGSSNLFSEIRRDRTIAELRYKILTWMDQ